MDFLPKRLTLNCRGRLLNLNEPLVMGILNLTPDSFSDGGQYNNLEMAVEHAGKMLAEGATILDLGGYSSRPGADDISVDEELSRIREIAVEIMDRFPSAFISIDTFRSEVARQMLDLGVHMINDISAGTLDPEMMSVVAGYDAPYMLMHMRGTPQTMQGMAQYENLTTEVWDHLVQRVQLARKAGITDIVIDPGFGFGKTIDHNYELFRNLDKFNLLGLPLLVGVSRKSMLYRPFGTVPTDTLELSSALHLKALESGANILRVHDVAPAVRILRLHQMLAHGVV